MTIISGEYSAPLKVMHKRSGILPVCIHAQVGRYRSLDKLRGAATLAQAGEGRSRCNSAPMHRLLFHKLILYK